MSPIPGEYRVRNPLNAPQGGGTDAALRLAVRTSHDAAQAGARHLRKEGPGRVCHAQSARGSQRPLLVRVRGNALLHVGLGAPHEMYSALPCTAAAYLTLC